MILQVITPQEENFDLPVSFPKDYIGKQVHVLFYVEEEVRKTVPETVDRKKPSDFFGILTQDEGEKFDQHIHQIRKEWNRGI